MKKLVILLSLFALGYGAWWGFGSKNDEAAKQKSATPVVVISTYREKISDNVEALGNAYSDESVTLSASVSETISNISFTDGQMVKKGDIIATLEQREEQAQFKAARVQLAEHERELARLKSLLENKAASVREYDERQTQMKLTQQQVREMEARLEDRIVRAPFDGVLGVRRVSVGALVRPGDTITTIDNIEKIKLDFNVPATHITSLKSGVVIEARTEALGDKTFMGQIESVDTRIDPVTRTVLVRAIIPNTDHALRPGLLMRVTLMKNARDALVVAEESVTQRQNTHAVWVINPETDTVEQRAITVGIRRPGIVEVTSGLKEGELVVVRGVNRVQEGQKVTVTEVWGKTRKPETVAEKPAPQKEGK